MKNLFLLQNALQRVDKHEPYRETSLKVNIIHQTQPLNIPTSVPLSKQEEDLCKALSSIVHKMYHSYQKQSKILLPYIAENEHVQIDDKKE